MTTPRTMMTLSLVLIGALACTPAPQSETTEVVEAPPDVAVLEGTSWVAESIAGAPVGDGFQSTISFNADGQAAGSAGCNGYFSAWGTDGDGISFGHIGATMMMCPEEQMEQEQHFMEALTAAERFELRDGKLLLHCTGSAEPTVLAPLEAEPSQATDG